jgi:hypothetical protein
MPTYEQSAAFLRDLEHLSPEQERRFRISVRKFVADLKAKRPPRKSFGIRRFERLEGVYEFHFAPDGRALFTYGISPHPGDVHIVWLRVGGHEIYEQR